MTDPKQPSELAREITLIGGGFALVDAGDYQRVSAFKWKRRQLKPNRTTYACRAVWCPIKKRSVHVFLHRFILSPSKEAMVIHLNGDGLDCRKANLAEGTAWQNGVSYRTKHLDAKSRYRGVSFEPKSPTKKWKTFFNELGRVYYLGCFHAEVDAARAYDCEARKRYGKFAALNFPDEVITIPPDRGPIRKQQWLEHNGKRARLFEWARDSGIPLRALRWRLECKWDTHRALTEPIRSRRRAIKSKGVE